MVRVWAARRLRSIVSETCALAAITASKATIRSVWASIEPGCPFWRWWTALASSLCCSLTRAVSWLTALALVAAVGDVLQLRQGPLYLELGTLVLAEQLGGARDDEALGPLDQAVHGVLNLLVGRVLHEGVVAGVALGTVGEHDRSGDRTEQDEVGGSKPHVLGIDA